ncbi:MAG: galactose oxidase-like domain-containing protein [Pseudomonadota bacterium]
MAKKTSHHPARRWPALALLPVAALLSGWSPAGLERFWHGGTEEDLEHRTAPVDRGAGPGKPAPRLQRLARQPMGVAPAATSDAHLVGAFGPAFGWPIIPIHTVLLADGRVLSFGADTAGEQTGLLYYALWDPALGTGPESHLVMDNVTATDTFCAGQALLANGNALLVGGDLTFEGQRNFGVADVNVFTPGDNQLTRQAQSMAYPRWYGTIVTNAQGEQVVMGGRMDKSMPRRDPPIAASFASTPEVYNASTGWRTLTAADSPAAYGKASDNWSYPHAWLAPDGKIAIITNDGRLFSLDSRNTGKLKKLTGTLPVSKQFNSAAMFAPGKVLSLRTGGLANVVDFNTDPPTVTTTAPMTQNRFYGSATVLADGKVWANGGSSKGNKLLGAAYHSELWDPATGTWATTATAAKPRLYHSISMLMPDGTVLTAGGGAPGPVINLNAEVYYPPYLYKSDGSGQPAVRPVIQSAPQAGTWGQTIPVTMADAGTVSKVSLLRFGGVTHAFANDPRYEALSFSQTGASLSVTLPASANVAPPGFYMLFALDASGVPSVAKVLRID